MYTNEGQGHYIRGQCKLNIGQCESVVERGIVSKCETNGLRNKKNFFYQFYISVCYKETTWLHLVTCLWSSVCPIKIYIDEFK